MSYTRGPLTVHHNGYEIDIEERIKAGTEVLATVHNLGHSREAEQHANAHLYAAAPQLLEALKEVNAFYDDPLRCSGPLQDVLRTVRDAIAAAEGRKE